VNHFHLLHRTKQICWAHLVTKSELNNEMSAEDYCWWAARPALTDANEQTRGLWTRTMWIPAKITFSSWRNMGINIIIIICGWTRRVYLDKERDSNDSRLLAQRARICSVGYIATEYDPQKVKSTLSFLLIFYQRCLCTHGN